MNRIKDKYSQKIASLRQDLGCSNILSLPTIEKIVVNMGVGKFKDDQKALASAAADLAQITGQKPASRPAKKAISAFKLRQGEPVGLMVTLRGERMWAFFDKLVNLVLPRIRDFHGVSRSGFDPKGNYSLGIREHTVFPDIDPNRVDRTKSLMVTLVCRAKDKKEAEIFLEKLGWPFVKLSLIAKENRG